MANALSNYMQQSALGGYQQRGGFTPQGKQRATALWDFIKRESPLAEFLTGTEGRMTELARAMQGLEQAKRTGQPGKMYRPGEGITTAEQRLGQIVPEYMPMAGGMVKKAKILARDGEKVADNLKPLLDEARKYKSSEELLRSGGFSNEALDKAAFGFTPDDIKTLKPSELNIKWHDDMLNPKEAIRVSGLTDKKWAKTVDLSEPVEVSFEKGKFFLEDGHHRYTAAKILNKKLNVVLDIKDNPITKLSSGYDELHREIFKKIGKE